MTTVGKFIQARTVFTVQETSTVLEAAKYMAAHNIGAVAVLERTRLVGIFSERDIITRVVAKGLDPGSTPVERVMTRELVVAGVDDTQEDCLRTMKAANCRHLPVISGDTLVGMISLRDLLQVELTDREEKLEFLTDYLFHVPPGRGKEA